MISPFAAVMLIVWGLFMIGGGGWAVYAGHRARDGAAADATTGSEGDAEPGSEDVPDDGSNPSFLGYLAAGVIVLFGVGVVAMGLYNLL